MRVGLTYDLDGKNNQACSLGKSDIARSLSNLGNDVVMIGNASDLVDKLAAGDRYDLVFNCCRSSSSGAGKAHIATLLDIYGIACTFSSPIALSICYQRSTLKSLLRDRGISTSDYWLVETLGDIPRVDAEYPVIVSSTLSNSAAPALVANDANELSKACCQVMSHGTGAMVEPQLPGETMIVGMLGDGASALCLMPNGLNSTRASAVRRTAQAVWQTINGCDAGCITIHCNDMGQPHVMSIDPMPSLEIDSLLMQLAQTSGISPDEVLGRIVHSAAQRAGLETLRPHLTLMKKTKSAIAAAT